MSNLNDLITHLSELNYFNSLYDVRVLSYLIWYQKPSTAKEISTYLEIPDSKVYPALNCLEESKLVSKLSNERPNKYYFSDPYELETYLNTTMKEEIAEKTSIIDTVVRLASSMWDPDEPELGNIAYLFRGNDINREILRITSNARSSLSFFLSPPSIKYISTITSALELIVDQDIKIHISLPSNPDFVNEFEPYLARNNRNISWKQTIYKGNTYIIRDKSTMLNITHQLNQDVAILTNDELMVSNIAQCWTDPTCCVVFDNDLIDLDLAFKN